MTCLTAERLIRSPLLQARSGDVWVYSRTDPVSRAIRLKTWSRFMHVEVAVLDRHPRSGVEMFTSRVTDGVQFYGPDQTDLALVLRPVRPFNQVSAVTWANTVVGQPFDWLGLSCFWMAEWQGRDNGRMFCSESAVRFLRRGGVDLFPGADADGIAPSQFASSPLLRVVWRSEQETRRFYDTPQEIA